jgi:hypothetical protein
MPAVTRPQKITVGEMRSTGVRGILVYCSDFRRKTGAIERRSTKLCAVTEKVWIISRTRPLLSTVG